MEGTVAKFTADQAAIFQVVIAAVIEKKSLWAFIDARGGCGKTFLINAILAAVRSLSVHVECSDCLGSAKTTACPEDGLRR